MNILIPNNYRLVYTGKNENKDLTFTIRTGTKQGIVG